MLPAAPTINPEERQVVVDSGASMHMVSKKDLTKGELETVRISKSPMMVMTANGEVLTENKPQYLSKTSTYSLRECFLKIQRQFFHWENSAKNLGTVTIGHVVKSHISSKMERKYIATHQNYVPFVVPGFLTSSSTSSSSTPPTSSSQETVTDTEFQQQEEVEVRTNQDGDRCMNQQKPKTQNKRATTKNYSVMSCKVCQIGYRSSSMDWLMKVFQNIDTFPVLLMNYLWSREQKWYRINTKL